MGGVIWGGPSPILICCRQPDRVKSVLEDEIELHTGDDDHILFVNDFHKEVDSLTLFDAGDGGKAFVVPFVAFGEPDPGGDFIYGVCVLAIGEEGLDELLGFRF